jgi:hypothetical protein
MNLQEEGIWLHFGRANPESGIPSTTQFEPLYHEPATKENNMGTAWSIAVHLASDTSTSRLVTVSNMMS